MQDTPETQITEDQLPPHLKRLRQLVTLLTVVMIAGVITIVALLVIRLNAGAAPVLLHPSEFAVPDGVETLGYSVVDGRTVLVGDDGVIRVFDSRSMDLLQSFDLSE